jgi:Holliday junction resolvase-like predicted endonuclease
MKKGQYLEQLAQQMLEAQGYCVYRVQQNTKAKLINGKLAFYSNSQDVFGCDLIAIKKYRLVRFIQVTADTGIKKRLEEWSKYPFPFPLVSVELWQAKKEKGRWEFRIGNYDGKGIIWVEEWAK